MKLMILSAFLLSTSAFASPVFSVGDWQCKAEGYDRFDQRWEVQSGRHIVIWEAERDAMRICHEYGYRNCRVFYCSDSSITYAKAELKIPN